jgi:hypothetical protein
VERRENVVGVRRHDRARTQPFTVDLVSLLTPRRPQSRERHRLAVTAVDEHRLLAASALLPLVEAFGGHQAAVLLEGALVSRLVGQ